MHLVNVYTAKAFTTINVIYPYR